MEYFFWRFGDLKRRIALSEKKTPLVEILRVSVPNRLVTSNSQNREATLEYIFFQKLSVLQQLTQNWTSENTYIIPLDYSSTT